MCNPAISIPRGHSYQRRHPSAGLLFHRSHAAGLFEPLLANQLCCSTLLSGDTQCQRQRWHLPFVPSSFPSFPSTLAFHADQSWAKYLKDVGNQWSSVLLSVWVSGLVVWCKCWYSWHKHMVSIACLLLSLCSPRQELSWCAGIAGGMQENTEPLCVVFDYWFFFFLFGS